MRQRFLFVAFCGLVLANGRPAPGDSVSLAPPDVEKGNDHYVGNRAPLVPSPLVKLPVGAIEPRGWVRTQLELQADGYTGRLTEISGFLKKEGNAWLNPTGQGDHGWEEVVYWLKGFSNLGYVLGNERIIEEAQVWIDAILASQKEDGWFGPDVGRKGVAARNVGRDDLWPNMIALFCLQGYYEHSGDPRVLELMTRYFRWEMTVPDEKFLPPFWQQQRAADNLYSVYWLYNRTGEPWLLELAAKIHRNTANWTEGIASWHNVNIAQAFGGPATYYMQSKDPKHLLAAERNYREVRRLYGQVPGGMFGGDENCRPGYSGPRQAIESCGVVEQMLSDETLLWITGNLIWADRCEDVTFNTLPATTTPDLKALRYLTAPNLVLSDRHNKSPGLQNRGPMLLMNPHGHRCCQHNTGHGWPYYAQNLWLATPENGLAAVMFAPCEVTAQVGDGAEVTIREATDYPFDESVRFYVKTAEPVRFPLFLRVPGWCEGVELALNGEPLEVDAKPRSYVRIDRTWEDRDSLVVRLPMSVRVVRWTENRNTASVYRGPLCYSLKIGEKYLHEGGTDEWPAWEIHPTTAWNYGLVLDEKDPASSFEVVRNAMPIGQPFEATVAPIELRAKAKKIPDWKLDYRGLVGPIAESPVRSDEPTETVTLIPMGCARLRISAFPVIGDGPDAKPWPPAPEFVLGPSASHCHDSDTVEAMCDGRLPANSNDHRIPRMTWWPLRGSEEWVQYRFDKPKKISGVEVYWFDDTGQGHCRVPESWEVQWLAGDQWKPVTGAGQCGCEADQFNAVEFDPVTTSGIRLKVKLQPEFSGGVLEWRLKE